MILVPHLHRSWASSTKHWCRCRLGYIRVACREKLFVCVAATWLGHVRAGEEIHYIVRRQSSTHTMNDIIDVCATRKESTVLRNQRDTKTCNQIRPNHRANQKASSLATLASCLLRRFDRGSTKTSLLHRNFPMWKQIKSYLISHGFSVHLLYNWCVASRKHGNKRQHTTTMILIPNRGESA